MAKIFRVLISYVIVIPLITFGLLEITLRIYDYFSPSFVFPDNSYNRFRGKPNAPDYGFHLNSLGFKDIDYQAHKDPGVYRILALGDSFVFGVVPYKDNFLTLLDENLDSESGQVEVLNFGIPDTNPRDYHALLVKEGIQFEPDLILVHIFIGNDFFIGENKSYARYLIKYLFDILPRYRGVVVHSQTVYEDDVPTLPEEKFLEIERDRSRIFSFNYWRDQTSLERVISYITDIQEISSQIESKLLVVLIPDELQVNPALQQKVLATGDKYDLLLPNRKLVQAIRDRGIDVLDLTQEFVERSARASLYKPRDTHWNRAGNRLAAELIEKKIRETGLE